MPMHVADHAAHMVHVLVGVVGLILTEDLDDLPARLVPLRLPVAVALALALRLLRLEPVLELLAGHVHGFVELLDDLLVAFRHSGFLPSSLDNDLTLDC